MPSQEDAPGDIEPEVEPAVEPEAPAESDAEVLASEPVDVEPEDEPEPVAEQDWPEASAFDDFEMDESAIAKEVKHSPRHAAHDPAALRLQFIQHAQLAAAEDRLKKKLGERKKWGGFFGKIQFKGLRRDSTGKTSRKLR